LPSHQILLELLVWMLQKQYFKFLIVCSVIPVFKSAAEDLLNVSGLSPVELLAKALAKSISSLLTSKENYMTLLLDPGKPIYNPSFAYGVLRRFLPEEKVESVRGLALTIDKRCAIFNVVANDLDTYLAVRLVVVRHIQLSNESTRLLQSPDGMNIIPYEYVINRQGSDRPDKFLGLDSSRLKKSMLVISDFIGCSPYLSGAIRVNP
nr:DEAD-box ATP-dependent RNA helicase 7 [Tanacetum cinerariifolium]